MTVYSEDLAKEFYDSITNPNAQMDTNHPYKNKVQLATMFIVAKK